MSKTVNQRFFNIPSFLLMLAALVFSLSTVFAWNNFSAQLEVDHYYNIGNFRVDLEDTKSGIAEPVIEYSSINIEDLFPTTDSNGLAGSDGANPINNLYRFRIVNVGNVDAMVRVSIGYNPTDATVEGVPVTTVVSDPGNADLSRYIKYAVRYSDDPVALGSAEYSFGRLTGEGDVSFDWGEVDDEDEPIIETFTNITLQEYFDDLFVSGGKYTTLGEFNPQDELFFEIKLWIGGNAEIPGTAGKTCEIIFTLEALQSKGGAVWSTRPNSWTVKL